MIQRTSKGTESGRTKTSGGRRSRRIGSGKNIEQKKNMEIDKYLVQWKGFMTKNDIWEKKKDLENTRELVDKFEGKLSIKVRRQERIEEI